MNDRPPEPMLGSATPTDEPQERSLASTVGWIATMIDEGRLSTGDVAELRRVDPEEPFTPALWKLLLANPIQENGFAPRGDDEERETQWSALLMGMAMTAGLHNLKIPLGTALAESGFSPIRFERLMRHTGVELFTDLRRMASYLASKSQPASWTDVAYLLFLQEGEAALKTRRSIARRYYQALQRLEKSSS